MYEALTDEEAEEAIAKHKEIIKATEKKLDAKKTTKFLFILPVDMRKSITEIAKEEGIKDAALVREWIQEGISTYIKDTLC